MGATKVDRFHTIKHAQKLFLLDGNNRDRDRDLVVVVDDKEVENVKSTLLTNNKKKIITARRRISIDDDDGHSNSNLRIVGTEFIAQSLICGDLLPCI